jgi:hypothetical protein
MSSPPRTAILCFWTLALVVPVSAAEDVDSLYGVVAFIPSPARRDAMRDAQIAWGRCGFSWRDIETAKGVFNWATTDEAVALANARGLHVYAGLGYTPAWASAGHRQQDVPTNPQDWYDFCFACVSRYKDSIHCWELWNEPNISGFWNGGRQSCIDIAVKVGADAIHAANPEARVLGPSVGLPVVSTVLRTARTLASTGRIGHRGVEEEDHEREMLLERGDSRGPLG